MNNQALVNFISTCKEFRETSKEQCTKVVDNNTIETLSIADRIILERNDAAVKLFDFVIKSLSAIE